MFVRSASPIWYFPNLVGAQLDDSYYLFTLSNLFPYAPVPIYHDPDGLIPWTDPIQFVSNGTLPVDMFWDPNLVYRLEVRQGPTQADPLIYLIENYIPNGKGETPPIVVGSNIENQITNGQFFDIDFVSPLTISAAGTYDLAPGWSLITTGTGTLTVTQNINLSNAATTANPLIPPYSLTFAASGSWTSIILQQRLNNLGDPWALDYVAMSLVGISNSGGPLQIVTQYLPQGEPTGTTIISDFLPITTYTQLQNSVLIPHSGNTNPNLGSYVDIQTFLPVNGSVTLSDFYIAPQAAPIQITYLQETIERQEDHLFHYYKDSILIQPKNTILTGWNFGLNPYQFSFSGAPTVGTTTPIYVADQTIFKAEQASSLNVLPDTTPYGSLLIQAISATTQKQFAVIQYIDPATMRGYWGSFVSALVRAFVGSAGSTSINIKMRLAYNTSLPSTSSSVYPIASYDGNGDPVFADGWTAIKPVNDPAYSLLTADPNLGIIGFPYSFNSFKLPETNTATQTLAVVFYIVGNLDQAITQQMFINEISLVPNIFAIDSNPETWDQSLRKCQYYYEKSYDNGVFPGSTGASALLSPIQIMNQTFYNGSGNSQQYTAPFAFSFNTVKRAAPSVITLYSPSAGTANSVDAYIQYGTGTGGQSALATVATTFWTPEPFGTKSVQYFQNSATLINTTTSGGLNQNSPTAAVLSFHFAADSRMGV